MFGFDPFPDEISVFGATGGVSRLALLLFFLKKINLKSGDYYSPLFFIFIKVVFIVYFNKESDIPMFKFLKKQNYFVHHHTLEHKGDFLFLHEKTSAKKTFVRENVESLFLLFFIFAAIGVLVALLFGYAVFWAVVFAAGTPMTNLMNLVFWTISVLWLCGINILPENIPPFLLTLSFVSLVFGNLFFISIHALPMFLKKKWKIAFVSLFIPIYWFLMSLATVRAVFQLFFNPHYWDKTEHGFVKEE